MRSQDLIQPRRLAPKRYIWVLTAVLTLPEVLSAKADRLGLHIVHHKDKVNASYLLSQRMDLLL